MAPDLVGAGEDARDGFGVGEVLLGEDAGGERLGGVGVEDGDGSLQDDDAVVYVLVDEVDGAAGDPGAEFESLTLGVEAGKRGEQRGVDVEDAIGVRGNKGGGDDAHVAGQADEIGFGFGECGEEGLVAGLGGEAGGGDMVGGDAEVASGLQARGGGFIREDDDDFCLKTAFGDGAVDGEEVGAAAGEEDSEADHTEEFSGDCCRNSRRAIRTATIRDGSSCWPASQI